MRQKRAQSHLVPGFYSFSWELNQHQRGNWHGGVAGKLQSIWPHAHFSYLHLHMCGRSREINMESISAKHHEVQNGKS